MSLRILFLSLLSDYKFYPQMQKYINYISYLPSMKTLSIQSKTHHKLMVIKKSLNFKSIDELINFLIDEMI